MEETRGAVRLGLTPVAGAVAVWALLVAAGAVAAGEKLAGQGDSEAVSIQEELVTEAEAIEKDFVGFIEMLEKRFAGELEDVEGQLSGVIRGLENAPGDSKLMAEVDIVKGRLSELASEVEALRERTRFLESGSAAGTATDLRPFA